MDVQPMAAGSGSSRSGTPAMDTMPAPTDIRADVAGGVYGDHMQAAAVATHSESGGFSFLTEPSLLENSSGTPVASSSLQDQAHSLPAKSLPPPVTDEVVPLGPSWTWRYFGLPDGVASPREATTAICHLCGATVQCGWPGKTGLGTSAMSSHLAHRHKIFKGQEPAASTVAEDTTAAATTTTTAAATGTRRRTPTTDTTSAAAASSSATPTLPRQQRQSTSGGHRSRFTGMPLHASTPRDDTGHYVPPEGRGYFAGCMQFCVHCREQLSCGETMLCTLLKVVKLHMEQHHPEMARRYAAMGKDLATAGVYHGGRKRQRGGDVEDGKEED